jgi:site-specific recombinase XerD
MLTMRSSKKTTSSGGDTGDTSVPRAAKSAKQVEGVYEKKPGSGVWYTRLRVSGKLIRKAIGTKEQAKAYVEKARTIRHTGEGLVPSTAKQPARTFSEMERVGDGTTVSQLADLYLQRIKAEKVLRDLVSPVQRVEVIKQALGGLPAVAVKARDVRSWLLSMDLAPASRNRYKSTLSSIYEHAVENEIVNENPCRLVKHYKVAETDPRWLFEAEKDKLRAVIDKWIAETSEHHVMTRLYLREHHNELTFAIGTGARRGNQYRLEWADVDFATGIILLRKTKTGKAYAVPMTDDVRSALRDQQWIQEELSAVGRRCEVTEDTRRTAGDRVFSIRENREWWGKAVKEARLTKHIRWHDLRHTTASRLAKSGANQKVIQSVLGHQTMAMSARYTHLQPEDLRASMASLNRKAA